LLAQHALNHLHAMIKMGIFQDVIEGFYRTSLFIPCPKDEACDAALHDGTGAHQTGLDGNIELASAQAVIPHPRGTCAQDQDLGMGSGIIEGNGAVMVSGHHLAIFHQDRTHRDLPCLRCLERLLYGHLHEFVICQ